MPASQPAFFHLQEFSDLGTLLTGGRLYTYTQGTTALKIAYTDPAGAVPQTYTADGLGGQYIALNARGELPAPLYLAFGAYDIALKRADGSTVWTRRAEPTGDDAVALAESTGASLVGFIQAGPGAVKQTINDVLRERISITQFGASPNSPDNTAAIQRAIFFAGRAYAADWFNGANPSAGMRKVVFPSATYKQLGKVIVPQGVIVDFQNATLEGSGYGLADNIGYELGYFNGSGNLVTNIGTAASTARICYTQFLNGRMKNFRAAFNLYDMHEGSRVDNMSFYNCRQNIVADYCFYARFSNCMSRGAAGGATDAAYTFAHYVNAEDISNLSCNDRVQAFNIIGEVNGQVLRGLSAEGGANGISFFGPGTSVGPLEIIGGYFEALTGTALSFDDAAQNKHVTIDNNFFNNVAKAVTGKAMNAGRIGGGNRTFGTGGLVEIDDNFYSGITVEIPPHAISNNGAPALPAGWIIGQKCKTVFPNFTFDAGSGVATTKTNFDPNLTEMPYTGNPGFIPGAIPYCTNAKTAGTNFSVNIDTRLTFNYYTMGVFRITVTDNDGVWLFTGRFYGDNVFMDGSTMGARTAVITSSGGFIRLTLGLFNHPSSVYAIEGVIRQM